MDKNRTESGSSSFTDASPSIPLPLTPSLTPAPAPLLPATADTAASSTFRAASVTGPAIYYLGELY